MADDAGALLVRSGLVSASALDDVRARVDELGGTIGEQLVARGLVADDALTDFYRQRLLVPLVNPNTLARLPAKVVAVIPSELAIELRTIPVSLDAENNLTVAMSDPSDRHAVDEIAFFTGAYVVRAVATQMQIAWCLAHYYGHVTTLGSRLMQGQAVGAAPAPNAVPLEPSPPRPRTRGHTGKVNAARHRVLAPITQQVAVQRPTGAGLDDPRPGPVTEEPAAPVPPPAPAPSNAVPETPRARTASGEIKLPRAASIKAPVADEASGPIITIEVAEDATGPRIAVPKRRTPARTDPPELAPRAGEVRAQASGPRTIVDNGPSIVVTDLGDGSAAPNELEVPTAVLTGPDLSAPVFIHSHPERESQPILLERRRQEPSAPPPPAPPSAPPLSEEHSPHAPAVPAGDPEPDDGDDLDDGPDTDIVVLETPKVARTPTPVKITRAPRSEKRTQIGMGPIPVLSRTHRDTEADGTPRLHEDSKTTRMDVVAVRASSTGDPDDDELAPPPAPAPAAERARTVEPRDTILTPAVMAAAVSVSGPTVRLVADFDDVDEGWGMPGTTIPPPLLGAMPGADDADAPGVIPIANVDSAPLMVAPPAPPSDAEVTNQGLVRELEDATARAIEVIRKLDAALDRDGVVATMVEHLASTHRRAGFFSIRPLSAPPGASLTGVARGATELALFSMTPTPASIPVATLRLDRPSTLEDVVGTRLPYRGPMHDDASRTFLAQILGACPAEILLVPVAIRDRVVGVLFGEHRVKPAFDDQLALAARAAGVALERILAKKK